MSMNGLKCLLLQAASWSDLSELGSLPASWSLITTTLLGTQLNLSFVRRLDIPHELTGSTSHQQSKEVLWNGSHSRKLLLPQMAGSLSLPVS